MRNCLRLGNGTEHQNSEYVRAASGEGLRPVAGEGPGGAVDVRGPWRWRRALGRAGRGVWGTAVPLPAAPDLRASLGCPVRVPLARPEDFSPWGLISGFIGSWAPEGS
ncbi:hypothetical protein NDU88_003035 [Pleurodeles waltl]|uniref:Uncharacterized protein n=1 Tax=Pleurodeles waltl TaxID=8319 RepID=A0AAV7WRM1_PLEWA|nr:hypothetical protein NDU88_003035 [Pleurodeles waltl]